MQYEEAWGILWRSSNRLDGKREYLMGNLVAPHRDGHSVFGPAGDGVPTLTFRTRGARQSPSSGRFGYTADRQDLRREPHGWRDAYAGKSADYG